jgi:integrase
MRKVWTYRRTGVNGWWVGWYESGRRKAKALPSKKLADHFCRMKYAQLNSDVFTGTVLADWQQMVEEYSHAKQVAGVMDISLYETALTLRHFERIVGKRNSKQITQDTIDRFIIERGREVKRSTLNKDIRNLKSFVNWCRKNRYANGELELRLLKEAEKPVRALSGDEIKRLVYASRLYRTMRIRILLALGTGLRRGDIESLKISDIDFTSNSITTASRKTGKSMDARPVSKPIMTELSKYVSRYAVNQERLFKDKFNSRQWKRICEDSNLKGLKFHDLRRTFCSILAQNGISTAVTQKLLEHASPDLTNRVYTNVDPVLRHAVDKIPAVEWL